MDLEVPEGTLIPPDLATAVTPANSAQLPASTAPPQAATVPTSAVTNPTSAAATAAPVANNTPATGFGAAAASVGGSVTLAPPAVRRLARELGVVLEEVCGTGAGGRITRDDVER